jgi:hypothetical protein
MFINQLGNLPTNPNLPDVLRLEWKAGRRDPYRQVRSPPDPFTGQC